MSEMCSLLIRNFIIVLLQRCYQIATNLLVDMNSRKRKVKHHIVDLVLRKDRPSANGLFPLVLKVTYGKARSYFSIPKELTFTVNGSESLVSTCMTEETYSLLIGGSTKRRLNDIERLLRDFILEYKFKAISIAKTIIPFDRDTFTEIFYRQNNQETTSTSTDVFVCFKQYSEQLKKEDRYGTARAYETASSSLSAFCEAKLSQHKASRLTGKSKSSVSVANPCLSFDKVTIDFLHHYEREMLQNNNSKSTVGMHLRALRAVYRKYGNIQTPTYPFGNGKYTIPTAKKNKRALEREAIKKILGYTPENEGEYLAIGLWKTSFYCGGLNPADIVHLRTSYFLPDKEGGAITEIIRQKTKRQREETRIEILLSAKQWDYVREYLRYFESYFETLKKLQGEERLSRHQTMVKSINKHLSRIALKLEIPVFTTYVARHSAATQLLRNNVPIQHISEVLGHKSITTTQIYLGSFNLEQKREFSKSLDL